MRFVVIGAGNMGCVYGANLARIGEAVSFLDVWEEHVRAITASGLAVNGLTGHFRIRAKAATSAADLPKAEAVLICVNSYSTRAAAEAAKQLLEDGGFCLTLQNGLGNVEVLSEVLRRERVLAGLSFQSGDLEGPGCVNHTNNGPTFIGELDGSQTERLAGLVDRLQRAGLNPEPVEDIITTIWASSFITAGSMRFVQLPACDPATFILYPSLTSSRLASLRKPCQWFELRESSCRTRTPWRSSKKTAPTSSIGRR